MAQIEELESRLVMPDGASGPLRSYTRYYAGIFENGRKVIDGELVEAAETRRGLPGIKIVPDRKFPGDIFDAGCGVIWFTYDPQSHLFKDLGCQPALKSPPPPPPNQ
jgi:hypothetical protein